ncbi:MAG: glycosyltransferase [Gammaproteobacteria bacterium]
MSDGPGFAVIVTALDETWSVGETVHRVVADNKEDLAEIIMATAPHATTACRAAIADMCAAYPQLVREHEQSHLPGVGGAIRECAATVDAQWIIMMASDLETQPEKVKDLIARAKMGDVDIVATSRWLDGGGFGDYSPTKKIANWLFQKIFSLLYGVALTDMTFGYRAYRTALFTRYQWRETGQAFFMESLVKSLRDGKRVVEIPVQWRRRQEGKSHVKLSEFVRYFRVGLTVKFAPRRTLLTDTKRKKPKEKP